MATSLMSGEVSKKDIVIPTGIPAEVKPRNTGMLEQEQNGVIAPKLEPIR
jgi:hypothetical protein